MLKCFAVDQEAGNFENHHVLQVIAEEAGVVFEPGSGNRSYLGVPSCPDKKNVVEARLMVERISFRELPRIAY